ncbi:MAG TPA: hypothetical protein VMN82_17780 [Thermoanaerobaculia bacterium]|nr:hypothetical protein [Thermoanaerobaculia bacterium]
MNVTPATLKEGRIALLVLALLFAAGNVVFFLTYRSGFEARRAALERRRDDLKHSVETAEAEAARVSGQKERLGGVSAAIEEFYGHRIGTERETLAPVVAEIHDILKENGINVPQINYSTTSAKKLPLAQMRITFTVRCDYGRFKQLLRAFETSHHWIAIREIGINRDTERSGSVQVQMSLLTYFTEGEGSAAPAESAAREATPTRRAG